MIDLSAFAEHLTRQFPVVGGPRAFAQPNNFDHGAEAFRSMIQVFSHMQDGLQPISWPVIGFTLNVSGFFHVGVLSHLKAHLHFTLLANARKRLRYGVMIFIEPTSTLSESGCQLSALAKLNLIPQDTTFCGVIYYE